MNSFEHEAIHGIFDIWNRAKKLHEQTLSHIKEPYALEIRDLTENIIYQIELWEMKNAELTLPKIKPGGAV